jgi:quercetin dioxygenase-like cupin family protein
MQLQKKSFQSPDEVRPMADKGHIELVKIGDGVVGKVTFDVGWRWSQHVKPIAGTDSCQVPHLVYVLSGHQKLVMDEASELDIGPGDVVAIPPGHDGWVVGNEPCVALDFAGMEDYAKSH